jgi:hypothetical protein
MLDAQIATVFNRHTNKLVSRSRLTDFWATFYINESSKHEESSNFLTS